MLLNVRKIYVTEEINIITAHKKLLKFGDDKNTQNGNISCSVDYANT